MIDEAVGGHARSSSRRRLVGDFVLRPAVLVAAGLWVAANVAVVLLADGRLPFDRPALAGMSFAQQLALPSMGLIEVFVLMTVVYFLTRRRVIPDMAARAPERSVAARETAALLGYALRTFLVAAPLTFLVFAIGTVLPTMVLIYAILVPRYLRLTGSSVTTVMLRGLTYAAMHFVGGWSVFTPRGTSRCPT
jgi:hypothetical protein